MNTNRPALAKFLAMQAEQNRRKREAVREFAAAVRVSDPKRCAEAFHELGKSGQRRAGMRAIKRLSPSAECRQWFLLVWVKFGDGIRDDVNNDLVLLDGLRALLPAYTGPGLTLFRGESFWNRKRRSYGLSWSHDREIARDFALFHSKCYESGSVLLEAEAPAEAIVCAVTQHANYGEQEYLVDRRRLGRVRVIERFAPQIPRLEETG